MKNKKILIISIITSIIIGGLLSYLVFGKTIEYTDKPLPAPELSEGLRGKYGIDKNINETTIDNYLNRSDTVYRDVRMLVDSASWENKGGDRYLTGYIKGFEVIPSPYLASYTDAYIKQKEKENVYGLYTGKTLFTLQDDGTQLTKLSASTKIASIITVSIDVILQDLSVDVPFDEFDDFVSSYQEGITFTEN